MQEYEVKRQNKGSLTNERLKELLQTEFDDVGQEGEHLVVRFGALERLECWVSEKKKVCVISESKTGVDNAVAADTIARYNRFLQNATGYSSKERRKKAMKAKSD